MGRPYTTEISELSATYKWAIKEESLHRLVQRTGDAPLISVGSGGSLSAASFLVAVHQRLTGAVATAATPLEFGGRESVRRDTTVWIFTAGGRNPDALWALEKAIELEPASVVAICTAPASPFAEAASDRARVDLVSLSPPVRKDGFLATNSLVASVTAVASAYARSFGTERLPTTLPELLGTRSLAAFCRRVERDTALLWARPMLIVLHGVSTRPAAIDLESRFIEAGLGAIHITDYRNFAHGKHNFLATRRAEIGVLALFDETERSIAGRTLDLLPGDIPISRIMVPGNPLHGELAGVVASIITCGEAGAARGIDPGRPQVLPFGRKLYHLRPQPRRTNSRTALELRRRDVAIRRKSGNTTETLRRRGELDQWLEAYQAAVLHLRQAHFSGVVLDYDGTLVQAADRFTGPSAAIVDELIRCLSFDIPVGIATGRGSSVRRDLQRLLPEAAWDRITVGYYNGGIIGKLGDSEPTQTTDHDLRELWGEISKRLPLAGFETHVRAIQISIRPKGPSLRPIPACAALENAIREVAGDRCNVVTSSHSLDVVPLGVSKLAVVEALKKVLADSNASILRIGDRGMFPGNDFELLNSSDALSVDEVSPNPEVMWMLSPPGVRGVDAALYYLRSLVRRPGGALKILDGA